MEVFWVETLGTDEADDKLLWAERYAYRAAMAECFFWKDVHREVRWHPEYREVEFLWYVDDTVVDKYGRAL